MKSTPYLLWDKAAPVGFTYLDKDIAIGRLPNCTVVINNRQISRTHALVVKTSDGSLLIDRSTNGVTVNGKKVEAVLLQTKGEK